MKFLINCTNCIVNQIFKIADILKLNDKKQKEILKKVLSYLSTADFNKCSPEIYSDCYQIMLKEVGKKDIYKDIKYNYNKSVLDLEETLLDIINNSDTPLTIALELAIAGNLLDLAIVNDFSLQTLKDLLIKIEEKQMEINHSKQLFEGLKNSNNLLYLGDNCGEIVLDKLFIKEIKKEFPQLKITYAVRGKPAVNDVLLEDGFQVKINEVATLISNGDSSLGTVLTKTDKKFNQIFNEADIIISKGQGNYESLSDIKKDNIYFLFMAKCPFVAKKIKVPNYSIICKNNTL